MAVPLFLSEPLREFLSYPENFLGRSDYRIVSAHGAAVAVEVVKELKPRLAVLDDVAGVGGEACRRLKADPITRDVTVLLALRGAGAQERGNATEAGADAVMIGEFGPADLLARIGELLAIPPSLRQHVRALFGVSFDARTVTGTFLGNTVNISEGGMLVEADTELPLDERIECRFFLPGDQRPVDIVGRVVRHAPEVKGQMPAYGVIFSTVSDEDMARIRHYVATRSS